GRLGPALRLRPGPGRRPRRRAAGLRARRLRHQAAGAADQRGGPGHGHRGDREGPPAGEEVMGKVLLLFSLFLLQVLVIAVIVLALVTPGGGPNAIVPVLEAALALLLGWASYLARVPGQVTVNGGGVLTALACLALLAVGLHGLCRWLAGRARRPGEGGGP